MRKECETRYSRTSDRFLRDCDYIYARIRAKASIRQAPPDDVYETARHLVRPYPARTRGSGAALEMAFREQVSRWKNDTSHLSSIRKAIAHPAYLRIIGLARFSSDNQIERLLLHELEAEPDHWFAALAAITGDDPVKPNEDFDGAVAAWLNWGKQKGII